jgi:hypothetical protein
MKHKKPVIVTALFTASLAFFACGGEGVKKDEKPVDVQELTQSQNAPKNPVVTEDQITISNPLNQQWVLNGKEIYNLKCQSCHKLTEEKVVGPGWKDVTKKRTPVWIINMITNTDYMLDSDPEAKKLLELCMVRMPNQNLSLDDARQVLEFQRSNDGEK